MSVKNLPTQERAIKKRIALLKAAQLDFSEVGFEIATAKSIAARANVATGTFYQYFENKNDILRVLAENRYSELHEQVVLLQSDERIRGLRSLSESKGSDTEKINTFELFYRVLEFLYQYHLQEKRLHQVLDQRRSVDSALNEIMARGEQVMRNVVISFLNDFELDDRAAVAESLHAMGEGLVHVMVFGKPNSDSQELLKTGAKMLASYFDLHAKPKN